MDHTPIVHVGLPKTASTALQKIFKFSDQLYYLGRGCGASMIDYISPEIEIAAEIDLRFRQKLLFNRQKFVDSFAKQLDIGWAQSKTPVFSSEYLGWTSFDEIDLVDKVDRLAMAFPSGAKILMFVREQNDLLKSLYREGIRQGFYKSYSEYVDYLWEKQDRNNFICLNYAALKNLYEDFFGKNSVLVLPYEWYRRAPEVLNEKIASFLDIRGDFVSTGDANKALDDGQLVAMRFLNEKVRHSSGNDLYAGLHDFFAANYFSRELSLPVPNQSLVDEAIRRVLIKASRELRDPNAKMDYRANKQIAAAMNLKFKEYNTQLDQELGGVLSELGYVL